MKRVVSVYLPTWPTDRARRQLNSCAPLASTPFIIVGHDNRQRVVTAVDDCARSKGITVGMPATKAMAMIEGMFYRDADPQGDADALDKLAQWALKKYSPIIMVDYPDGLLFEMSGACHLFGGETALLHDIVERLRKAGIQAKAAMAPHYGAAHALARHAASPIMSVQMEAVDKALSMLPVVALRLSYKIVQGLTDLGIDHVHELVSKPRAPLALRFGPEVSMRIDQALGRVHEPMVPVALTDLVFAKKIMAEPISTPKALTYVISKLVEELCAALEKKQVGARTLDLVFQRVDDRFEFIRIGLARPVRDMKRLTRMLRDKLETVDPGLGIETMTLIAPWVESLGYKQMTTMLGEISKADIASLVDTINNRLGLGHIYQAVPVESDIPERSIKCAAPLSAIVQTAPPVRWPRPARLLNRPEPIETIALLPDHPPVSFTWRGTRRKIQHADGPERVFGEWWKRAAETHSVRDYFQVEDDRGERFWVFREGDGVHTQTGTQRWYVHGVFA